MIICFKCKKEIKEKVYPTLQVTLGPINSPWAVDPKQPIHTECLRKNIDDLALTTDEKKQALEVLATL
jgi:hypothetical protein